MPTGGLSAGKVVSKTLTVNPTQYTSNKTITKVPSAGVVYMSRAAAASTLVVNIPINMPRRVEQSSVDGSSLYGGAKITKIEVPVSVLTAALSTAPVAVLYRTQDGIASTIASTSDLAKAVTTGFTVRTITPSALAFDGSKENLNYNLQITFTCATTSDLKVAEATAFFDTLD